MSGLNQSPDRSDVLDTGFVSIKFDVEDTEVFLNVSGSNMPGRQLLLIHNDGANNIWVGPSGVTSSGSTKGIRVKKNETYSMPVGEFVNVYAISNSAGTDLIIQELS